MLLRNHSLTFGCRRFALMLLWAGLALSLAAGSAPAAARKEPVEKSEAAAPEKAAVTKKSAAPAKAAPAKLAPGEKVNINTATKEELDKLPGIGPVKARRIVEGRPFDKIEDIMKVKGIKKGEFNKIKDLIRVR